MDNFKISSQKASPIWRSTKNKKINSAFQNLESELFDPKIIDESGKRSGRPRKSRIK